MIGVICSVIVEGKSSIPLSRKNNEKGFDNGRRGFFSVIEQADHDCARDYVRITCLLNLSFLLFSLSCCFTRDCPISLSGSEYDFLFYLISVFVDLTTSTMRLNVLHEIRIK